MERSIGCPAPQSEVLTEQASEIYYCVKGELPGDNGSSNDPGTVHQCGWAITTQKVDNDSINLKWSIRVVTVILMQAGQKGGLKLVVDSGKTRTITPFSPTKTTAASIWNTVCSFELNVKN